MDQPYKRIWRSRTESRISGVCGGLGLYLGVDPVVVRLALVVLTVATGLLPGILIYLAAWAIMPAEPLPPLAQPGMEQGRQQQGHA